MLLPKSSGVLRAEGIRGKQAILEVPGLVQFDNDDIPFGGKYIEI